MKSSFGRRLSLLLACGSLGAMLHLASAEPPSSEEGAPATQTALPMGDRYPAGSLPSTDARPVELSSLRGRQATVFVFLSTECPISNGYLPTLNRLAQDYGVKGVRWIGLNSNDGQTLTKLAEHRREFAIEFPILKDAGGRVADSLGVTHCPEVCVLDADGQLRYRGRIDDRYSRRGGAPNEIRSADLQAALDQLLGGQPIAVSQTEPLGCPIHRDRTAAAAQATAAVTYQRDISRLLQQHCQRCHRPGGIGPFALLTYDDAVTWADDLVAFTADGSMPPWKAVDGHGEFHNRRRLAEAEKSQLAAWVQGGCPEGNPADAPPAAAFSNDWALGPPDLVLAPATEYELGADGEDIYRCFVLPTDLAGDQYITALEVLPGNPRVVHHVIAFLDTTAQSTLLDARDAGPGYNTSAGFPGFFPSGGLGGWAPGNAPHPLPDGMAKVLPKGAKVVMQVHYHKTGKAERDRTQLGLYFSKVPVTRAVFTLPVMPFGARWSGMEIRAGESHQAVTATINVPRDLLAVSVTPHMHLLGKDLQVTATLPDGSSRPLIFVQNWDFNWQESYQYVEPVALPKGTRLDLVAHFDNSPANRANPRNPPQNVHWGEQTTDEMCIAFFEVVSAVPAGPQEKLRAPKPGDMLREAIRDRLLRGNSATRP